ncbi:MAG: aldehyde dehydrogenase family protein [Hyphomonas sp.]
MEFRNASKFYINGKWVEPATTQLADVIDPVTEAVCGQIALGNAEDVDRAVQAARRAFGDWGISTVDARLEIMSRILEIYQRRIDEVASAITLEMGAPANIARNVQAEMGVIHMSAAIEALKTYRFSEMRGSTCILYEPIGVCSLITPWNWPINQVVCKVAPALATGCTMVLKPAEVAPLSTLIWAEILDEAGVPPGVFNLVNGTGEDVGVPMSTHPEVDMVSFTGSTRAGINVARNAADTVKRVHQELGGKSANILLPDADFETAVEHCVKAVALNSGQNCNAPTRLLVPADRLEDVERIATTAGEAIKVGAGKDTLDMGPVISDVQWSRIQDLIESGVAEGAHLLVGGPGKPEGFNAGYFVRYTIFSRANNKMRIAQEEIFGPVLTIIPYGSIDDAVEIANDTPYGLASYVSSTDEATIRGIVPRLRSGQVVINGTAPDPMAPFGGYKQSGNGREWGDFAFHDFLEVKAALGYPGAA